MTIINEVKSVDQATHRNGKPNADRPVGVDEQRDQLGQNTAASPQKAAPGRLPLRAASNERRP